MSKEELSREDRLALLASETDRVVTLDQLVALKYSPQELRTLVAKKLWQRPQRGVYFLFPGNPTWRQDVRAAMLGAGDKAQLFGPALAAWAGLDGAVECDIEIVVACGEGPPPRGVRVHRTRHLSKKRKYDGIVGTSAERLLVDYAAAVSVELAERAVESALTKGLTAEQRIWREIAELGEAVPGVRSLNAIMMARPKGKAARSSLELDTLKLIRNANLPLPERNFDVYVDGEHFEIDLAYLQVLGAIEVDSKQWHSTATQQARDRRRQDKLELGGWTFLRLRSADVYGRPEWVIGQIRRLLRGVAAA